MGRYDENYWSDYAPFGMDQRYGCEITDSETGLVGKTYRSRSSKEKAHSDAWDDLQSQLRNYSSSNENTVSSGSYSTYSDSSNYNSSSSEKYSSTESYSGDYGSSSPGSYGKAAKEDSSTGCSWVLGLIIIIVIIIAFSERSCIKEPPINRNYSEQDQSQFTSPSIENDFESRRNALDGKWIKVSGFSDRGIVVSFFNNVGTITSIPENGPEYALGRIEWQDFDPEKNWLQVYVHGTGDGYLNTEVKFQNSETIRLSNGDRYERQNNEIEDTTHLIDQEILNSSENSSDTLNKNEEIISHTPIKSKEIELLPSTNKNPYGEGKGRFVFWTTRRDGQWEIYIDESLLGKTRYAFTFEPDCFDQHSFIVDLPEGLYKIKAIFWGRNFKQTVSWQDRVIGFECKKLELQTYKK